MKVVILKCLEGSLKAGLMFFIAGFIVFFGAGALVSHYPVGDELLEDPWKMGLLYGGLFGTFGLLGGFFATLLFGPNGEPEEPEIL